MKSIITQITIAEPCSQNWELMEKRDGHNFCTACSKCVIDFSGYSNSEIIKALSNSSSEVCGRLSQSQLNQLNYHLIVTPVNRNWMKYLGVLAIGASIFVQDANASITKPAIGIVNGIDKKANEKKSVKVKKIYGYVIGADKKPKAGIRLVITNTKLFALTDKNGRYEIEIGDSFDTKNNQLSVESIRFSAILNLDYSKEKQDNLVLNKAEPMIMGMIIMTNKESR